MRKIRIGILFGGRSAEHDVSIRTAKSVIQAIDCNRFEVIPIGIDRMGGWHFLTHPGFLEHFGSSYSFSFPAIERTEKGLISFDKFHGKIDVVFPLLHGPYGEDGTVQGLLKLLDIPFVGAGVLGSAISMDKIIMKRLLKEAGLLVPKFCWMARHKMFSFEEIVEQLGLPFFIKPSNMGSSIGIHKIKEKKQFEIALEDAFSYDHRIILEKAIKGREIECSVLGNENPIASLPGEVIPNHEFYHYEAKYLDPNGADFHIPAQLPESMMKKIQDWAIQSFEAVCCEGMARVDFFLAKDRLYVNEINTIPGFTPISLYPKLWEVSGICYADLIEKLIELAIDKHQNPK